MTNPHLQQAVLEYGCEIGKAGKVAILIHGRGQTAQYMQENIVDRLALDNIAYFAPSAANSTWYPMGFMADFDENEPWLSHTLECVDKLLQSLLAKGYAHKDLFLIGFSQGACVVAEYICRYPERYAGVGVFTGGLIGPAGTKWPGASLQGTPVLYGTSDIDPWIPLQRAEESRDVLGERGAVLDFRVYKDMDHIINDDEIAALRDLIQA